MANKLHNRLCVIVAVLSLAFLMSLCLAPHVHADTVFTSVDLFDYPGQNGSMLFSVNGSYASAEFNGSAWQFTDLKVGTFRSANIQNLTASVENSDIAVLYYRIVQSNTTLGSVSLRYTVKGEGIQVFSFGALPPNGFWSATVNGNFIGPGNDWKIAADGTLIVIGAHSDTNVTLIYYFPPNFLQEVYNQPFYIRHSASIVTGAALAVTILASVFVWKWRQQKPISSSAPKEAA